MGNSQIRFDPENEVNLLNDYIQVFNEDSLIIYKSKVDGQQIREYDLLLDNKAQYDREKQVYYFRKDSPYLVSTRCLVDNTVEEFCSTHYSLAIYIEHIHLRLSHIKDIPYPDALHLIQTCLRGFAILYEKAGYFRVQEDLIGINNFGQAKVWINSQFHCSEPEMESFEYNGTESDIVLRIIGLIERNTDPTSTPVPFPAFYKSSPCGNAFRDAIAKFHEYLLVTKQQVPPVMDCTLVIVKNRNSYVEEQVSVPAPELQFRKPIHMSTGHRFISNQMPQPTVNARLDHRQYSSVRQVPTGIRKAFTTPVLLSEASKVSTLKTQLSTQHPEKPRVIQFKQRQERDRVQLAQPVQLNFNNNAHKQIRTTSTHLNRFSQNVKPTNYKSISPKVGPMLYFRNPPQPVQPPQQPKVNFQPPAVFQPSLTPTSQTQPSLNQQLTIHPIHTPVHHLPMTTSISRPTHHVFGVQNHIPMANNSRTVPFVPQVVDKTKMEKRAQLHPHLVPLLEELSTTTSKFTIRQPIGTLNFSNDLPVETKLYATQAAPVIQFDSNRFRPPSIPLAKPLTSEAPKQLLQQRSSVGHPNHETIGNTSQVQGQTTAFGVQSTKKTIQNISKQLYFKESVTQVYIQRDRTTSVNSFFPRFETSA